MNINVKPQREPKDKNVELVVYGVDTDIKEDGVKELSLKEVKEDIEKETQISKNRTFHEMTIKQLDKQLDKFINAVSLIKNKMINGTHYLEIPGVQKPIITKQGTAWLAAATNMTVKVEEVKCIMKPEIEFIFYQHEATASWGASRSVSAQGSANSQEYNQKRKYEDASKQKTVYDTINDVSQMSQKRARSQAIREMIAMTDIFETNEDNPLASTRKQMGIYTLFYKHFLTHAPDAPKKTKLKNGKWKFFTEKEKLNWKKEYLKNKFFTPMIYKLGLPTYGNWGTKDIELLEKEIPEWPKRYIELSYQDKEDMEDIKNAKKESKM